ncbi:GMC family oxidoreductase [Solwaraspora sp. WMMD792]|uniref:FAD-dependent oxidoreductase n=1 Tax=Solwaraspora sp. WMMD792 TaxID=3016099 RepID=UPI0024179A9F|nr:GMC family oxidoreductase [Solwaraspora sp. WMMD792]MDG4773852.1 GMC family oxidoreductase [Solwaraspora sp. WMMD792]
MTRLRYGPEPTAEDSTRVADVCVIGSGASGAITAWALQRAGLDVVVVEQGPFVDPWVSYDDIETNAETAWIRQDSGLWEKTGNPWSTCNVGGGTVFFGGAAFRHRPVDFDSETRLGHGDLPLRWPWTVAEIEPYYALVESALGIAGGGHDPSLPSDPVYPMPPVETTAEGAVISAAARSLGLHPFPTPLAITTTAYQGRPPCGGERPCISNQCDRGAKGDAVTVFLDPARKAGLRLFAGLKAVRIRRRDATTVDGVECIRMDSGNRHVLRARHVVVAGNAVQSAALLLRSTDKQSPHGLGNDHDMVGRGLCFKMSGYVLGYRRADPPATPPDYRPAGPGPFSSAAITDYYTADDAPGGFGGLIIESGPEQAVRMRPDEQILRLECLVPDQPSLDNRVSLGRGVDQFGLPDVVMDYSPHPRDHARLEYLQRRAEGILRAAGCELTWRESSYFWMGSTHLHGTCRAGTDPRTSVTDPDGRVHGLTNLMVVDGGVMPYPGGVNPTLTIQALALRMAHRLLRREFGIEPDLSYSPVGTERNERSQ